MRELPEEQILASVAHEFNTQPPSRELTTNVFRAIWAERQKRLFSKTKQEIPIYVPTCPYSDEQTCTPSSRK